MSVLSKGSQSSVRSEFSLLNWVQITCCDLIFFFFFFTRWYGQEKDYNVLVMDLLGPSLEDLFNFCSRRFTMKTVLMLADQVANTHTPTFFIKSSEAENFKYKEWGGAAFTKPALVLGASMISAWDFCGYLRSLPQYKTCKSGEYAFSTRHFDLSKENSNIPATHVLRHA